MRIIIISNSVFNEEGEQLAIMINKMFMGYFSGKYPVANKFAENWMLMSGDYAMYKQADNAKDNQTATMKRFRQNHEARLSRGNNSYLANFFIRYAAESPEKLRQIFEVIESGNPMTEEEVAKLLSNS